MDKNNQNSSYWLNNIDIKVKESKFKNKTDILIIGAGMTGIMTAYELSKTYKNIIVVDANKVCTKVSSKTSAKISTMHNLMYQDIKKAHGIEKTKEYYSSQNEAIKYILDTIKSESIDCDLEATTSYNYCTSEEGYKKLDKEYKVLKEIGVDVKLVDSLPTMLKIKKAIKCENQYLFHPMKYISKIVDVLNKRNIPIFEGFNALDFDRHDDGYSVVFDNGKKIKAKKVVVATNYPIFNPGGLYFAKLYQEKNYLIAFETNKKIDGSYINTELPVRSLRFHRENGKIIGIMVCNSHKAGDDASYKKLVEDMREVVFKFDKDAKILNEWTNQDTMSIDFLPFIGKYSRLYPNMFVATSFETWGMTNSHVAASLLSKLLLDQSSPYEELYNPLRFSHIKSIVESGKIIGKAIDGLIISRFTTYKEVLSNIKKNTGGIIKYDGICYAAFNNDDKEYIFLKPTCTHTKCFLRWNEEELTWDCKCHGSRFDVYGNVLTGPAVKPLERVYLSSTKED